MWCFVKLIRSECDIRMDFDTNEYPNIFVLREWHERISEYIRMNISDTNEYPNEFGSKTFEYICHTLDKTGTTFVLLQSK